MPSSAGRLAVANSSSTWSRGCRQRATSPRTGRSPTPLTSASALLAGGFTAELLEEREWTTGKLHDRLRHLIDHALLTAPSESVSTGQRSTIKTQTRGKLT